MPSKQRGENGRHRRLGQFNPRRVTRRHWAEFIRYCLVGVAVFIVNVIAFSILFHWLHVHYLWASTIAFFVAWLTHFVLHKYWTFRSHSVSTAVQGIRNLAVNLAGLVVTLFILWSLVKLGVAELASQIIAIAVWTPFSFVLNRLWAFRPASPETSNS